MKLRKLLKGQKGFSLIELLIVIGIIAILAVIIIPRFSTSSDDAKYSADEANVKLLQSAIERYHFDKGVYPIKDDDGEATIPASGATVTQSLLIEGKYISEEAKDPWKASGVYKVDKNGTVQPIQKRPES